MYGAAGAQAGVLDTCPNYSDPENVIEETISETPLEESDEGHAGSEFPVVAHVFRPGSKFLGAETGVIFQNQAGKRIVATRRSSTSNIFEARLVAGDYTIESIDPSGPFSSLKRRVVVGSRRIELTLGLGRPNALF